MGRIFLIILAFAAAISCGTRDSGRNSAEAGKTNPDASPPVTQSPANNQAPGNLEGEETLSPIAASRNECFETDTGDNVVLRRQTFVIDFEPFRGACFVTSHNPEFDDPPMESEIGIYSDGKKIFDFPEQFNGAKFGCWIDAVAFEDLNSDGLKDIIIVGKCSAKSAAYNENTIYVNTGSGFVTNTNANFELGEFTSVKDISDFVKANQKLFFK